LTYSREINSVLFWPALYIGTAARWPYLILLQAVPAIISLAVTPFMPDTPRYLMIRKNDQVAAQTGTTATRLVPVSSHS